MARPEYYDLPHSHRRPPPSRGRAGAAAPNDFGREPCDANYAADSSAADIDKAYDLYGPARGPRGGRSLERRPQSAATARRSGSSAQPRSAGGAGCHGAGLSAHDAARNRAVLAAAALKPPRVDRVARYQCVPAYPDYYYYTGNQFLPLHFTPSACRRDFQHGLGSHNGGLSAHDAARNRAVLATSARKPQGVDRMACYRRPPFGHGKRDAEP